MLLISITEKLIDIEHLICNKKIIVFGTGKGGKLVLAGLDNLSLRINYFLDNNPDKQGKKLLNIEIKHPNILKNEGKDNIAIIIASSFYNEISNQLNQMGFIENLNYFSILKQKKVEEPTINQDARNKRIINGVEIGKYSYGVEKHCFPTPYIERVGAFCSINHTALIGLHNHPTSLITTHPFIYYPYDFLGGKERIPNDLLAIHNVDLMDMESVTKNGKVTIGNDVWIGAGTIILPNLNIGNGSIIAAGAVVTKDVPDYAVVAGVPAKVIKFRFTPEEISILNEVKWWDWSDQKIAEMAEYFKHPKKFFRFFSSK